MIRVEVTRQEPLDASCQQREVTVNIATRSQLSKNHYSIIWLTRRCCCHNTYISLIRWKTNRHNLFLQIKYWSAVLYRASGVCLKNECTRVYGRDTVFWLRSPYCPLTWDESLLGRGGGYDQFNIRGTIYTEIIKCRNYFNSEIDWKIHN